MENWAINKLKSVSYFANGFLEESERKECWRGIEPFIVAKDVHFMPQRSSFGGIEIDLLM